MTRLPHLATVTALVLALTACGGSGQAADSAASGDGVGRTALPGPVPTGVAFAPASKEGIKAPAATVRLVDGTDVELATWWKDRPVVLVFFSTWCQWCQDNQSALNQLAREQGDAALIVGVTGDESRDEVTAYAGKHSVSYPLALDPELTTWRKFAVTEPPLVAVVAPGGQLVRGWPGGVEVAEIKKVLAGFRAT